jgi:hypothetical protein
MDFLLAHACLCLTSFIHHTPTVSPNNLLMYLMRFCIFAYTCLVVTNCYYGITRE